MRGGPEVRELSGADGAVSADSVHAVLSWASLDVTRFVGLLRWLCVTAYEPRVTREAAEEELADLGLGVTALAPLRSLLAGIRAREDVGTLARGLQHSAGVVRQALTTLPADGGERPRVARFHAALLVLANILVPGTMDFAEVDEAAGQPEHHPDATAAWPEPVGPEQYIPDFVESVRVAQSGDFDGLDRSAARLRQQISTVQSAGAANPTGSGDDMITLARRFLTVTLGSAFAEAARLDGSLQDADAALTVFRGLRAAYDREGSKPPPLLVLAEAPVQRSLACRSADPATGLRHLVTELETLYAVLPVDHELRWVTAAHLGDARYELAVRTGDPAELQAAARCARQVVETDVRQVPLMMTASFPLVRAMALIRLVLTEPTPQAVERAVEEVHRIVTGTGMRIRQELELRYSLGRALLHAADRLGIPALLDACIDEFGQTVKGGQTLLQQEREVWPHSAEMLASLSVAFWRRGQARPRTPKSTDRDLQLALNTREVSLQMLPVHVMYQHRTEHRLTIARTGATHAQWLAYWNLAIGCTDEAVSALERGRSLVLRAAAATHGTSDRLTAAGRSDLAARHRELLEDLVGSAGTATDLLRPAGGPQFFTGLRRAMSRELNTLASRMMLEVPDAADLAVGLLASGADALVYLLPGPEPGMPGYALVIRPGAGGAPAAGLKLPLLTCDSSLLRKYLDAAAQRSRYVTDPTVHESWQAAWEAHWRVMLSELCDWAWEAAMGEILATVGTRGGTPRLVLVPCGALGAVPWHAARTACAADAPRTYHYACEDAVISYASSGEQFLRAAARQRMPTDGLAVLVDDPELTLMWSGIETDTLAAVCYPGALRYGDSTADGQACDAPGSPDDVLAVLPGGSSPASVLHIACHGLAGTDPTRSALFLAAPHGAERDAGRLTVARALDGAAETTHTMTFPSEGPLVVLSACETDLSTRDHDESLTLATALVARGAADVVGTRWVVDGSETALMAAAFHHARTALGLAPPDALRAAQLWMLDPDRQLPAAFDGVLRQEATRTGLHQPWHWAGLTHQGNISAPTRHDAFLTQVRWCLMACRMVDDRHGYSQVLTWLAELMATEHRFDEAIELYDAALATWPDGEHPDHQELVTARAAAHNTRLLRRLTAPAPPSDPAP